METKSSSESEEMPQVNKVVPQGEKEAPPSEEEVPQVKKEIKSPRKLIGSLKDPLAITDEENTELINKTPVYKIKVVSEDELLAFSKKPKETLKRKALESTEKPTETLKKKASGYKQDKKKLSDEMSRNPNSNTPSIEFMQALQDNHDNLSESAGPEPADSNRLSWYEEEDSEEEIETIHFYVPDSGDDSASGDADYVAMLESPTPPPPPPDTPDLSSLYSAEASERGAAFRRFAGFDDQASAAGSRGGHEGGSRREGGSLGRPSSSSRVRANRAIVGDSGWVQGDRIIEICVKDEDIPPTLRASVMSLEERRAQERRWDARVQDEEDDNVECMDEESYMTHEIFKGDKEALEFQWFPMATFSGHAEEFQTIPGPKVNVSCGYEAFRKFWDDDIMQHIVTETNRYAVDLAASSVRFARDWYDTNVHEIMLLFAFWMMLGIVRLPSIRSCYTNNYLLKTGIFKKLMGEARYWNLNKALNFVDSATRTPDSPKLFDLGPVADHLNAKFKEAYTPGQNIVIEESLTLWKGKVAFRQYIESKTATALVGIKTFGLCESATGYMWSFIIYTGKDYSQAPMAKSTEVVIKLMRPLLNKGYRLYLDNSFNSPLLARFLKRNQTDCIGTLRSSRKNVPAIIQTATLPKGTCIARHSGDVVVMLYQDKKPVTMITTCHGTESVFAEGKPGRPAHYKPAVIAEYNRHMGGVDKKDQMLEPYLNERKRNHKWFMKIFKRLLNVSINNSRILFYRSSTTTVQHQAFRLDLVDAIVQKHLQHAPLAKPRHDHRNKIADLPIDRLIPTQYQHFLTRSDATAQNRTQRLSCLWCLKRENKRSQTVYLCHRCDVPLCVTSCFEKFHSVR